MYTLCPVHDSHVICLRRTYLLLFTFKDLLNLLSCIDNMAKENIALNIYFLYLFSL